MHASSSRLWLSLLGAIAFSAVGIGTQVGLRSLGLPSFPAYALAQLTTLLLACGTIRAVVGPDWSNALDARLPRVTDLALAVLGWPAVSILILGLKQLAVTWMPTPDPDRLQELLEVDPRGVTYVTGRSLLIPVVIHVAQNSLGVLEGLRLVSLRPFYQTLEEQPAAIYLGAGIVLTVVLALLLRRSFIGSRSTTAAPIS
jgi:hypothetical protein